MEFLIYIKNMEDETNNYASLFEDNSRIMRKVEAEDFKLLQEAPERN